jgi:methionyl-tRNA synthetase
MSDTYYVTTPIYYVNDAPHIGHSYTTIAADVLARYWRAQGRDVRFLTGTDEHGIKMVKAADERGVAPRALADENVVRFQDLWKDLEISRDDFIRTTEARHEDRVREFVRLLVERDEVYLGQYTGWYDEGQEEFVTESAARQTDYKGAISGKPLVRYEEPSYFFRLSKWAPKLVEHIRANPSFVQPDARRNEVLSKLAQGVEDLSISRTKAKLGWGVEMPNDAGHVVYVWIDALSNYCSALGIPAIGDEYDDKFARYWPADVHLIGKDILWFHAVYWPCMLMALDLPLPKCVFAHGWWTSEGRKMSKSLGNFISRKVIREICDEYSVDVFRYYLLRAVNFGSDGNFAREGLLIRYNTDLANGIGNLLSRVVNMIGRYFDGAVPSPGEATDQEAAVMAAAEELRTGGRRAMEACAFHAYLDALSALATATNVYIDRTEPFKLAKDQSQRARLGTILYTCAEAVRILLLHLQPVMPVAAPAGLAQIGWKAPDGPLEELARWGAFVPGTPTGRGEALFPRKD